MSDLATTIETPKAIKRTLETRKAIKRQVDGLIRAAAEKVKLLRVPPKQNEPQQTNMKESQLRNLLNVAIASDSIEEVTNFIRYQMGRDSHKQTWLHEGFGEAVIKDIEADAVRKAVKAVMEEVKEADPIEVRSQLISLYLGYLNRCFVYASNANGWEDLSARLEAREEAGTNG
jgi:hypothetical protein